MVFQFFIMKKILQSLFLLPLLFMISCQTEEHEVFTEQDQNSITTNMEAYDLVYRAAMYDGSSDDEIDNSTCFSMEFPYILNFQGVERPINTSEDLRDFLEGLPANNPQDIIPDFPLTVINTAHQRLQVNNRQQFAGLQQACRNSINASRGPITCAKFQFPLSFTSYNSASQQTGSAVLNSPGELFIYLDNLTNNSVVSFVFPLEIIRNSTVVTLNNRAQLVNVLRECD